MINPWESAPANPLTSTLNSARNRVGRQHAGATHVGDAVGREPGVETVRLGGEVLGVHADAGGHATDGRSDNQREKPNADEESSNQDKQRQNGAEIVSPKPREQGPEDERQDHGQQEERNDRGGKVQCAETIATAATTITRLVKDLGRLHSTGLCL